MADYSEGTIRKNLARGQWQGIMRYRDCPESPWKAKTPLLGIACDDGSQTGERIAMGAFRKWRENFIAKHDQELADEERRASLQASSTTEYVSAYIDTLAIRGRQPSTISGYRRMLGYIENGAPSHDDNEPSISIGSIPLEELTREAIQAWVNDMSKRLAPVTVKKGLTLLRAALKNACRDGRLDSNAAEFVEPPAMKKAAQNPLNNQQQIVLLKYLDTYIEGHPRDPSRLAIKTALLTGMRQGEICALTWSDIDFTAETITVNKSIGRQGDSFREGNKSYYVKGPKNGGSRRTIPIPGSLGDNLKQRHANMSVECRQAGVRLTESMYVFGTIDGQFMNPHGLWMKWKRIAKRLNLVGLDGGVPKFHDLRHTFATTAIKNGMDVKTLSSILGHSNAAMTLNIYASADPDAKRLAMNRMDHFYQKLTNESE